MNSNQHNYEKVIDLKDLLATLFDKWVIILVCIIIGALVGVGLWAFRSGEPSTIIVTAESVEEAREGLNIEQIEQVDYLFAQYKSNKEYRKLMQNYMAGSLFEDTESSVMCIAMYYIESDIHNVNKCFANLAVGKNDMEQIAAILGEESAALDDVNRRIKIEDLYSDFINGNGLSYSMDQETDEIANKNTLQVSITADNEEQAEQMLAVIDAAFQREAEVLRNMDPDLKFTEIGRQYSSNLTEYMQKQEAAVISALNDANNQINLLQTNYVDKLNSDEKAYYKALKDYDEQEIVVVKKPSLKKYAAIGAILGLLLSVIVIILWYVFNGRVKTTYDVSGRSNTDIPYVVYKKKSGFHLFGAWSRKLKGADLSDEAVVQDLIVSDLAIKLSRMDCSSAYIARDEKNTWQIEVVKKLQSKLQQDVSNMTLHVGNPLSDTAQLQNFSESDAVILAVQLKDTSYKMLEKWIQLSGRYERPVVGAVVMEEC